MRTGRLRIPAAALMLGASLIPAAGTEEAASLASEGPTQPAKVEGGRYFDRNGNPTYRVTDGGRKVDWPTMSGYLRYNASCIVCHGPDGAGSSYAPSLVDALKRDDYPTFVGIVTGGKRDVNAAQDLVMPAFADDRNVMCYVDDIYTYLRARSDGVLGRGRPPENAPPSEAFRTQEDACMK